LSLINFQYTTAYKNVTVDITYENIALHKLK